MKESRSPRMLAASVLTALTLVAMALPIGVPMTFAPSPETRETRLYAFFNPAVIGLSGNILPFCAAVLTLLSGVAACMILFGKKPGAYRFKLFKSLAELAFVASLFALWIFRTLSVGCLLILLLQLTVCLLLIIETKKSPSDKPL